MILSSLFFAASGSFVKSLTRRLPTTEVVFFRFAISAVLLIPWMIRRRISLLGSNHVLLFSRSLCGFVAGCLSFYVISQIALADATMLNYSSPIFVAVLSALIFKERVTPKLLAYILMAAVSCLFILKPQGNVVNDAGSLGLLGALFSAFAYLGIKRLHQSESSFTVVFHFSAFSAVSSALLFESDFLVPTFRESLLLLGCGVVATFGQILMTRAYKESDASIVSPYSYATILFSALFGIAFWNEVPDIITAIGGLLMVLAGIGIARLNRNEDNVVPSLTDTAGKEAIYAQNS